MHFKNNAFFFDDTMIIHRSRAETKVMHFLLHGYRTLKMCEITMKNVINLRLTPTQSL